LTSSPPKRWLRTKRGQAAHDRADGAHAQAREDNKNTGWFKRAQDRIVMLDRACVFPKVRSSQRKITLRTRRLDPPRSQSSMPCNRSVPPLLGPAGGAKVVRPPIVGQVGRERRKNDWKVLLSRHSVICCDEQFIAAR
jgi:hypothetical protein